MAANFDMPRHERHGSATRKAGARGDDDRSTPEYPVERICSHLYEPFQLNFARHAEQMLEHEDEIEIESTHAGLLLRGETENALERAVATLQDFYGDQIRIAPATVRYHQGTTLEQPHMGIRVRCRPADFEAIRTDLEAQHATIVDSECTQWAGVVRATAPLAELLGYAAKLSQLTGGTAHEVMWLSHYAPVESPPPDKGAA